MKRLFSFLMIFILLCGFALAEANVPQLSDSMFAAAKQALVCLASGEYERLVTLLPFSDVAPGASEWQRFAEGNFSTLDGGVQSAYSVAYWNGSSWSLAVPVAEPSDSGVEALVLSSSDGATFAGYRFAHWGDVVHEYESASYVVWCQEYVNAAPVIAVG